MRIYLPAAISVLGLSIFAISDNPKLSELGRVMYWTGLLVTLIQLAAKELNI